MEKICLDTEVVLDFLLGEKATVEKLGNYADREEICINSLSLYYLYRTVKRTETVTAFAHNATVVMFDSDCAAKAAEIAQELAEKGVEKPNDVILTAAMCIVNHAFLLTRDRKKFDGIKGLKLV